MCTNEQISTLNKLRRSSFPNGKTVELTYGPYLN